MLYKDEQLHFRQLKSSPAPHPEIYSIYATILSDYCLHHLIKKSFGSFGWMTCNKICIFELFIKFESSDICFYKNLAQKNMHF